jgi:hypothetical protein
LLIHIALVKAKISNRHNITLPALVLGGVADTLDLCFIIGKILVVYTVINTRWHVGEPKDNSL